MKLLTVLNLILILFVCRLVFGVSFQDSFEDLSEKSFSSQEFDYGKSTDTRRNSKGGYDYYSSDNRLLGHSEENRYKGYNYYDDRGNKIGSIREIREGMYTVYNSENAKVGALEKLPSKKYFYRSFFEQKPSELDTIPGGDIGSLTPQDLFR